MKRSRTIETFAGLTWSPAGRTNSLLSAGVNMEPYTIQEIEMLIQRKINIMAIIGVVALTIGFLL